jgi:hypothetical protein
MALENDFKELNHGSQARQFHSEVILIIED